MRIQTLLTGSALTLLLGAAAQAPRGASLPSVAVRVSSQALQTTQTCSAGFVAHDLPHTTQGRTQPAKDYDGNGSGVALGDLNNDGRIDIVLANLNGPTTILWNQGRLNFKKTILPESQTRAVSMVDINGDGWLDISVTHNIGIPGFWLNQQGKTFVEENLPGIRYKAFTLLWDDLEGNGALDLVTASYDAILETDLRDSFLFSDGAGVAVYEPSSSGYIANRLARNSQALGLIAVDLFGTGKRDLLVGNDFDFPDQFWQNGTWKTIKPFPRFSKHTMGYSLGDINNDAVPEIFSSDMKPDFRDLKTLATWMPWMEPVYKRAQRKAPQKAENFLQSRNGNSYDNRAYMLGLDAAGWAWSAKFGDLDNDGFQDLYIVNGFIDAHSLKYLPGGEMVEENVVFRNIGGKRFDKPTWNLNSTRSGRGMSMADLDNDGDLDIVVNNFASASQLFENQMCGKSVELELRWQGTRNTRAIGAQVIAHSSAGTQWRQITSLSGFISGDAPRVQFGLGKDQKADLEIIWPDNKRSTLTAKAGTLLTVTRKESQQ